MSDKTPTPPAKVRQIMPSDGWAARMLGPDGGPYLLPLLGWALLEAHDGTTRVAGLTVGPKPYPVLAIDDDPHFVMYEHELTGAQSPAAPVDGQDGGPNIW